MDNVIYVPYDPKNKALTQQRFELVTSFMNIGWVYGGSVCLKDQTGQTVWVTVLTKPIV